MRINATTAHPRPSKREMARKSMWKKNLRIHLPEDKHKYSVLPHTLPILYMILGEIAKVRAVCRQCAHSADPRCYKVLTCRCCPLGLGLGLGFATDQQRRDRNLYQLCTSSLRPHTLVAQGVWILRSLWRTRRRMIRVSSARRSSRFHYHLTRSRTRYLHSTPRFSDSPVFRGILEGGRVTLPQNLNPIPFEKSCVHVDMSPP